MLEILSLNRKLVVLLLSVAALRAVQLQPQKRLTRLTESLDGIYCSGLQSWGPCYEKAGETCGTRGYEVLEKSGDQGGANPNFIKRSIIIQCKE